VSTIKTKSKFYFDTSVTSLNRSLDFSEGMGEIQVDLKVGAYSLTNYAKEIQRAMREGGSQAYVVTVNRATRKLTISAPMPFRLLAGTGTRIGTGIWSTAGFSAMDLTGFATYTGQNGAGKEYLCQYPLDDYSKPEHVIVKESGTVNNTPLGLVQQTSFADGTRISMNMKLITNKTGLKNFNFVENPNGINDFMYFMAFLMTKGQVEFIEDVDMPMNFQTVYLEKTKEDSNGLRFQLKNMFVDIYESGTLTFRKVII
jgi:hypothetical protein